MQLSLSATFSDHEYPARRGAGVDPIVTRGWRSWTIHYLTVLPDYGIAVLLQKQSVNNIFT